MLCKIGDEHVRSNQQLLADVLATPHVYQGNGHKRMLVHIIVFW